MAKKKPELCDEQIDLVIELAEKAERLNYVLGEFCNELQDFRPCTECSGAIEIDGDTVCMVCFDDLIDILAKIRETEKRKPAQVKDVIRYGKYLSEVPQVLYDFCNEHCGKVPGNGCDSCPGRQASYEGEKSCPLEFLDADLDDIYSIVDELNDLDEDGQYVQIRQRLEETGKFLKKSKKNQKKP